MARVNCFVIMRRGETPKCLGLPNCWSFIDTLAGIIVHLNEARQWLVSQRLLPSLELSRSFSRKKKPFRKLPSRAAIKIKVANVCTYTGDKRNEIYAHCQNLNGSIPETLFYENMQLRKYSRN